MCFFEWQSISVWVLMSLSNPCLFCLVGTVKEGIFTYDHSWRLKGGWTKMTGIPLQHIRVWHDGTWQNCPPENWTDSKLGSNENLWSIWHVKCITQSRMHRTWKGMFFFSFFFFFFVPLKLSNNCKAPNIMHVVWHGHRVQTQAYLFLLNLYVLVLLFCLHHWLFFCFTVETLSYLKRLSFPWPRRSVCWLFASWVFTEQYISSVHNCTNHIMNLGGFCVPDMLVTITFSLLFFFQVENNPRTGNFGALVRIFLGRTKELKISTECQEWVWGPQRTEWTRRIVLGMTDSLQAIYWLIIWRHVFFFLNRDKQWSFRNTNEYDLTQTSVFSYIFAFPCHCAGVEA